LLMFISIDFGKKLIRQIQSPLSKHWGEWAISSELSA